MLNSRCSDLFEIVEKSNSDFKRRFNNNGANIYELHSKCKKVREMWAAITHGMHLDSTIWNQVKMNLVLEDETTKKELDWGRLYDSDKFVYDNVNFCT